MRQFEAALFDLDGVVFDTEPQYSVFWGSQCRLYHPEHPGLENEIKGQTLQQIFDRWWSGDLEAERPIVVQRLDDFEAHMDYDYVEGVETFVADLRRNGVKTAVVTSSNRVKMSAVYASRPGFTDMFDAILTSEDFAESKPSPDCYLRAAARFGLQPAQCVVFEDSINGLRSGRAAGMAVVGLTTTNSAETVSRLADVHVASFAGLSHDGLADMLSGRG